MGPQPRFDIFLESHIGFGIRWETNIGYPLVLSFAFPFVTILVGIGPAINGGPNEH